MAAVPFTGTATFRGVKTGNPYILPISASDVAAAFYTFTKSGLTVWQPPEDVIMTDLALLVGGTDTNRTELFIGGADSNLSWINDAVLVSIPLPRLAQGVGIAQGAQVQFMQRA